MARVVLGTYAFRYPLGGNLSWTIQWAAGFQRLGHDVYLAEKCPYADACFDPLKMIASNDCSFPLDSVPRLLDRFGLGDRWCLVDHAGNYYGLTRPAIEDVLRSADLLVDLGTHGAWHDEASRGSAVTVLVDGEPGYTQMRRELKRAEGQFVADYDFYYSNGAALGTPAYTGPTDNRPWRAVFNPVVVDLFPNHPPPPNAPFTTVMTWQAHKKLKYGGVTWRQKDVEFKKFSDLPSRVPGVPLDLAISGGAAPVDQLHAAGWTTRSARETTLTYDGYLDYIARSAGEFSVCKQAYVALHTGWFSDRSAAYLAAGRPVVMQDTGFGAFLPCGIGLFAVNSVDEAAAAVEAIHRDRPRHSSAARELARAHLDASTVLVDLQRQIGL